MKIERITCLDSLRGLAVVFMVQQHLLSWLWNKKWISYSLTFPEHPVLLTLNFLGNFAAPIFLLVAGAVSFMLNEKQDRSKYEFLKRGLFILFCGYILNLVSPHWFSPWSWYILHTIGIAIILSPIFLRIKTFYLIIISALMIFIPPVIQTWLNTPLMIGNIFMNNISMKGGILRIAFAEGHFPLFPWLAFFITGIVSYRWIKEDKKFNIIILSFCINSAGIILASCYRYGFFFATGGKFFRVFVFISSIYPAHPPFILLLLGISLIILYCFTAINADSSRLILKSTAAGRLSLSWFFIHIVIFNEFLRFSGLHGTFSGAASIFIISGVICFIMVFSNLWMKYEYKFSVEWLMRKIVGH